MVPLAGIYWCSRESPAFTVQMDLASHLCSLELGVWGWRSRSTGPALLSNLMDAIPTLLSPCSRYTDNLVSNSLSENYSYTVGMAGWTHSWVLGWYMTLIPAVPAILLPALVSASSSGHKQPCTQWGEQWSEGSQALMDHKPHISQVVIPVPAAVSSHWLNPSCQSPSLQLKIEIAASINLFIFAFF